MPTQDLTLQTQSHLVRSRKESHINTKYPHRSLSALTTSHTKMRLPPLLTAILSLLSCPTFACAGPDISHLTIKPLFTVDVRVGKNLKPIPIRGGQLLLLPITGGRAHGPALNGTIASGLVRANYFKNRTVEYPNNVAYGTTEDGESFVIEQTGAGGAGGQAARLVSLF